MKTPTRTEYEKASVPFTAAEASVLSASKDRDVRLFGEYWAVRLRINALSALMATPMEKRAEMRLAPLPLMIEQMKGMKKYANALAIRLHYEQGGTNNPNVVAKAKAHLDGKDPETDLAKDPDSPLTKSNVSVSYPDGSITVTNADAAGGE